MHIRQKAALSIMLCLLLAWLLPFAWHEALTWRYGTEFKELQGEIPMIGEASLRVLAYSPTAARVYAVGTSGDILTFTKEENRWQLARWETVWSKSGSADSSIWPYFYHTPQGLALFILAAAPLGAALGILMCRSPRK